MSNVTFDIKCVRADPQSGICELPSVSNNSSITVVPYSGTFTLPATIPSNSALLPGGAIEFNTLSLFGGGSTTSGYYKIIDNLVEVTQIITGIDYTAPGSVPPDVQHVGYVELDIPVGPSTSPISGTATWFGPLFNPAVPAQVTYNNIPNEANQVCVPGVVFPLSGGSPSIAYATIGPFRFQEVFANPPASLSYLNGVLVIKYEYLM